MPAVRLPDPPLSDGEIVLRAWRLSDVPALTAAARAVDGTAEAIPLRPASADAVTVAQAFHWFDGEVALAEIHRVLRPGGALALVWNRRRMDDPLNRAVEELIAPYRGHTPALRTGAWRAPLDHTARLGGRTYRPSALLACGPQDLRGDTHGEGTGEGRQGPRVGAEGRDHADRASVRAGLDHEDGGRGRRGARLRDPHRGAVARPRPRSGR